MTLKDVIEIVVSEKLAAIAQAVPHSPSHEIRLIELEAQAKVLASQARARAVFVEVDAIPLAWLLRDLNQIDALGR